MSGVGSAIAAVGAVAGGAIAASGAKSAGRAGSRSAQAGIDEQARQYDLTRSDLAPYRQVGTGALGQLAALYGIPQYQAPAVTTPAATPTPTDLRGRIFDNITGEQINIPAPGNAQVQPGGPVAPDHSSFFNSPDYRFALEQGEQAVLRNRSAMGGLASGNTGVALQRFGQGLASQQYGNYVNRLASLAGIGQSATDSTAAFGAQAAGNTAQLLQSQGDARASGIAGSATAIGSAVGQLAGIGYNYFNQPKTASANLIDSNLYSQPSRYRAV